MPTPAHVRTYTQILTTGTPGHRIAYVSVLDVMQQYIYKIKTFLLAGGCTLKWTSAGGTGPSGVGDTTDRLTSAATVTPRATVAAASQAWFVVVDGNGGQLLIAFQGSSDNICRISYSPTAAFALAGTTTNQPTATDEMLMTSTTDITVTTASSDRILHGHISSDAKAYRFWTARLGLAAGVIWGVEPFTPQVTAPAVCDQPVFAYCWSAQGASQPNFSYLYAAYSVGTNGGRVRAVISSAQYIMDVSLATWASATSTTLADATAFKAAPALQGSLGYIAWPNALVSMTTANAKGYLGELIDFWTCNITGVLTGDLFGVDSGWYFYAGWLQPNPSLAAPTLS